MTHPSTKEVYISNTLGEAGGIPSTNVIDEEHCRNTKCHADNGSNDAEEEGITVSLLLVEEGTVLTEECLPCELLAQHYTDGDAGSHTITT